MFDNNNNNDLFNIPEGVKKIIIICCSTYVIQHLLNFENESLLYLYKMKSPYFRIWQPVTYMFMHSINTPSHLLFNMLSLWMFGSIIENSFGKIEFLKIYFCSGIIAGIIWSLSYANTYSMYIMDIPLVGASAGIYGIATAFAYFWPNARIYVMMIFPIKSTTLIMILIFIGAISSINPTGGDRIAHIVHILGCIISFIYLEFKFNYYKTFDIKRIINYFNIKVIKIKNFFKKLK